MTVRTQLLLYAVVTGCATLLLAAAFTTLRLQNGPKRESYPRRCPTCGGESFETESAGHAELADYSDMWFWYGTCQACNEHCASKNHRLSTGEWKDRFYVPSTSEWEDSVARPHAESELQRVAEERLKEEEYRKYKWTFDREWPFETERSDSTTLGDS